MNWIDLLIIVVSFIFLVKGAVDGALSYLMLILAGFLAFYFTYPFSNWIAGTLFPMFSIEASVEPVYMSIMAFASLFIIFWAIGRILGSFLQNGKAMMFLNHLLGAIIGAVLALAIIGVTIAYSESNLMDKAKNSEDARVKSKFYYQLNSFGQEILNSKFEANQIKMNKEKTEDFTPDLERLR